MTSESASAAKPLDLGHEHTLRYFRWAPDDLEENRLTYGIAPGEPMPVVDPAGASVRHRAATGDGIFGDGWCESAITFDLPELPESMAGPRWQVESWNPLTTAPSLLCRACGDHGYIREGRWEPAEPLP